jgi:hypothetical protein
VTNHLNAGKCRCHFQIRSIRIHQTYSALHNQKYLITGLLVIFAIWYIPYLLEKNTTIFLSDLIYIPLSIFLVVVAGYRVIQSSSTKYSAITWIVFLCAAIAMLVAEHIWSLDELILGIKPFPSYADVAFVTSYLLWIPFFVMLIKPLKNYISKKIIVLAICISCAIIIPNLYNLIQSAQGTYTIENTLLSSYPIIDGFVYFPAIIGMILFFKGKTNFGPSLVFFAMLPQLVADILFQINSTNGTYYTGSLAELFFYLPFIIFMFGAYDLRELEKKQNTGATKI